MTETTRPSGVAVLLLSGALALLLFLPSCGKKEAEPELVSGPVVAAGPPMNVPRELQEYKDPKGAFVVMLPKGYAFSDKTVGDKVKYIFAYGSSINLIVSQSAAAADWDSAAEMTKKQDEIRTGSAGFPPDMALLKRELLSFGGLKGFYALLAGTLAGQETEMMAYYLAGDEKLFTLIVTWKDPSARVLNEQLKSSITNSFQLTSFKKPAPVAPKPAAEPAKTEPKPEAVTKVPPPSAPPVTNVVAKPAPVVAKPKPVEPAPPPEPVDPRTDSEWAAAKAMLKFTGSMKMGGQQVAMVNDKILRKGDTISVMYRDTEFTFIVSNILPNGIEYKRKPLK